jgi:cob(I)alamin adenosyltransferase
MGAQLATTADQAVAPGVEDRHIDTLEAWIDRLEAALPPLTQFILPGGTPLSAQLHVCRTICRRAERRVVSLRSSTSVDARILRYLNRLADLLFVMARWAHHRSGGADIPWRPAATS